MELSVLPSELDEFVTCSSCHLPFNDHDAVPKLLQCRHYFCIKCINLLLGDGHADVYCLHCWKKTELTEPKAESLPTHNAIIYLIQNLQGLFITGNNDHNSNDNNNDLIGSIKQERSLSLASNSSNSTIGFTSNTSDSSWNLNQICGSINSTGILVGNLAFNNNNNYNSNNDAQNVKENCLIHAMPNSHWCCNCRTVLCRACASTEEHRTHTIQNELETKEHLQKDITAELQLIQNIFNDLQQVVLQQREFHIKILESCTALKAQIENELMSHVHAVEIAQMREILGQAHVCLGVLEKQSPAESAKFHGMLYGERQRLMAKYRNMFFEYKIDELIGGCELVFSFDMIKQTLIEMHKSLSSGDNFTEVSLLSAKTNDVHQIHPFLLLANYCIAQLYTKNVLLAKQLQQQENHTQLQQQQEQAQHSTELQQQQQQEQQQLQQHFQQLSIENGRNNSNNNNLPATYAQALQQNMTIDCRASKNDVKNNNDNSSKSHQPEVYDLSRQTVQNVEQKMLNVPQHVTNASLTPIGQERAKKQQQLQQQQLQQQAQLNAMYNLQQLHQPVAQQIYKQQQQLLQEAKKKTNLLLNPSVHIYPIYYFDINMNGRPIGRILIEVHSAAAPKMSKNFGALATRQYGFGYKGCHIFQCWEDESIITGDFELNNGRGGRSIYNEGYFVPDDTKMFAIRGTVGMRRSRRRHAHFGLVGSQFRIILRDMRGFTGIFAFVIGGIEFVEKMSRAGDASGRPHTNIIIENCGQYKLGS